MRNNYCNW